MTGLSIYMICNLLWFLFLMHDLGSEKTSDILNVCYEYLDHNKKDLALVEIIVVLVMAFISIPATIVMNLKGGKK